MNFVSYSHLILLISGQTFELQSQNAQVELSSSATGATPRRYALSFNAYESFGATNPTLEHW